MNEIRELHTQNSTTEFSTPELKILQDIDWDWRAVSCGRDIQVVTQDNFKPTILDRDVPEEIRDSMVERFKKVSEIYDLFPERNNIWIDKLRKDGGLWVFKLNDKVPGGYELCECIIGSEHKNNGLARCAPYHEMYFILPKMTGFYVPRLMGSGTIKEAIEMAMTFKLDLHLRSDPDLYYHDGNRIECAIRSEKYWANVNPDFNIGNTSNF